MRELYEGNSPEIEEDERKEGQLDALIVFGFGIKDPNWMQKQKEAEAIGEDPSEITDRSEGWMLSLGAKLRVQAAAELYLRDAARKIIFTGGATREKDGIEETEAQVMEEYFLHILRKRKFEQLKDARAEHGDAVSQGIERDLDAYLDAYIESARQNIIKEDKATNTIENFSRTLTVFDENPEEIVDEADERKNIMIDAGVLSSRFHIARIGQLAEQFMLKGKKFGAEDVILATRIDKRHGQKIYDLINRYTDPNTNEEYRNYLVAENRWSRGLKEVPEYFLPQTILVTGKRLREILKNIAQAEYAYAQLLEELNITPEDLDYPADATEEEIAAKDEEIRSKIASIDRKLPPAMWASAEADKQPPLPPFPNEARSEIIDPLERAKNIQKLIFSDVDGTLIDYETEQEDFLIDKYMQMVERCSGEVILTSSKSRGDLERLKRNYRMSELAPVIFENGAGIAINKKLVSLERLKEIARENSFNDLEFSEVGDDLIVAFSPEKHHLKRSFGEVTAEIGVKVRYIAEMDTEEIARIYAISVEEAQKVKDDHPEAKKYFMENFVFEEEPSAETLERLRDKSEQAGLYLTKAKRTWHLMSKNANKGNAVVLVQAIYRSLSPKMEESIGLGDAANDFEMFKVCDRSFFVSDEEKLPEHTTQTKEKGLRGATEAIREIFLTKENE